MKPAVTTGSAKLRVVTISKPVRLLDTDLGDVDCQHRHTIAETQCCDGPEQQVCPSAPDAPPLSRPSWGVGRRSPTRQYPPPGPRSTRVWAPRWNQHDDRSAWATASDNDRSPIPRHGPESPRARRRADRRQPLSGVMTTRGYGSSPSDRGRHPSTSLSASWTILRSAEDIGSSTRATTASLRRPFAPRTNGALPRPPPISTDVDASRVS